MQLAKPFSFTIVVVCVVYRLVAHVIDLDEKQVTR
jgi:hypothetical protein